MRFLLTMGVCLGVGMAWTDVSAVIDAGTVSGSPGEGWDYVGTVGGASGVYLGEYDGAYWVLTANHVGLGNFTLGADTYSYVAGSGKQVGSLDLYVFKIDVTAGSSLLSLSNLTLSDTSPTVDTPVVLIGNGGANRGSSLTYWSVNSSIWTETTSNLANASGYKYSDGRTRSWGTNNVAGSLVSDGTEMLYTVFDARNTEGQAAVGDSGGGMFVYNATTGHWELAGLMTEVATYGGQPSDTVVFGDETYAVDIASYRDEILTEVVPEPAGCGLFLIGAAGLLFATRKNRAR